MRPPICEVCDAPADDGGLVRFAIGADERAAAERRIARGGVGHPPGAGWFCVVHVEPARALAAHRLAAAVAMLRAGSPVPASPRPREEGIVRRAIAPEPIDRFATRLRDLAAAFAAALEIEAPAERHEVTRTWHPMDRVLPPNCPFSESIARTDPEAAIRRDGERAWWGPDRLARAHERLAIQVPGPARGWWISGHIPADGSTRAVAELLLADPVPAVLATALDAAFPAVAAAGPHPRLP